MPYRNINPLKKIKNNEKVQPEVPFTEGNDMFTFFQDWINSPEYMQRLQSNAYKDPQNTVSNRASAINNLNVSFDPSGRSMANPPVTPGSPGKININKRELDQLGIPLQTGLAHELSHVIGAKEGWQNPNIGFNETERNILRNSITREQPNITGSQDSLERKQSQREVANWKYLQKPEEIKADLDASRWNLFDKGIFDIRKDGEFTPDHLNKAKDTLMEDNSFKRLLDQTGEDNFIHLMNTIALNNNNETTMAAYGGKFNNKKVNPMNEFALGGAFDPMSMGANMLSGFIPQTNKQGFTSVGGSTASGALKGAGMGAALGPPGAIIGGLIGGGASYLQSKGQRNQEEQQFISSTNEQQRNQLASMNYGIGQSSNLPMYDGGTMNSSGVNPIGTFTDFETGGTHESNPNGGIPQGVNSEGQMRTTEEGESKFKFKDTDYVFSDRLIF